MGIWSIIISEHFKKKIEKKEKELENLKQRVAKIEAISVPSKKGKYNPNAPEWKMMASSLNGDDYVLPEE